MHKFSTYVRIIFMYMMCIAYSISFLFTLLDIKQIQLYIFVLKTVQAFLFFKSQNYKKVRFVKKTTDFIKYLHL
jgi:hypothetical protein